MKRESFWVLRYDDGSYYKIRRENFEYVDSTDDPMKAERFESKESARHLHDRAGHFYHQAMTAVEITVFVELTDELSLPARERSTAADEDRS